MADEAKFKVNGVEYDVPTDLSLGEMCDCEREFGVEFGNARSSGIRMVSALLWIAIRRVDSSVTVDDIRSLPADTFAELEGAEALPPNSAAAANATSGSSGGNSSNDSEGQADRLEPIGLPV